MLLYNDTEENGCFLLGLTNSITRVRDDIKYPQNGWGSANILNKQGNSCDCC